MNPPSELAIGVRPDQQVEVVGHQAIAEEIGREPGVGVADGLDEGVEAGLLAEDLIAAIAAVEHVTPGTGDGSPGDHEHPGT